jgi:zinc protease
MKNKLTAFALLFLITLGIQAQIDRTKQPEAGPAPEINLGEPETITLDNGLKVLIVENHKLPRVSMTFTLDNPPHPEGSKAGVSSILSDMFGSGTKKTGKNEFNEEIDYLGANINFFSSGASANTLSKYFPRVLELMAEGALMPNFTQEEFDKSKERTLEGLKIDEKNVASNARKLRAALSYGKNHPYGEMVTTETVESLTLANVKSYYNDYFSPKNAYLVIVGDVDEDKTKDLVKKYFGDWKKKDIPSFKINEPINAQYTQVNFLNMPNAVQSEVAVVNTIKLKKSDKDYFPAIIANQILGGGGEGRLFLNLREDKGYTYGAYSSTGDDRYVSSFVASASVRNAVTDSAVVAFLDEIYKIRNEKISAEELSDAKSKYVGGFVRALEQPSTIARYALDIETDKLSKDFYKNYLQNINKVTIEDVQRVAKKYFLVDNARIVIAGKGSEVMESLENLTYNGKKIPVIYFDKEGNEVSKPEFNKAVDASVNAESIFNKYINAIGGKEAVSAAESVMMVAQAEIQGQILDLEVKNYKGMSSQKIAMSGNVLSKQVYNGETGFTISQGQRMAFTDKQLVAAKADANPFPELDTKDAKVMGIEPVDGKDAYAVALTEDKTAYYDIESGLKVKAVSIVSQGDQTMEIPVTYSNYQEVNGIKFPFTISQSMGPQTFEFKVSAIKVNDGVSDEDFME